MGKKQPASSSPAPDSNSSPGFNILWETKVKRDIFDFQFLGGSLIIRPNDLKGISCFDPAKCCETWEFRPKGDSPVVEGLVGDRLAISIYEGIHFVDLATGEGGLVKKLKSDDSFYYSTGTHAIFSIGTSRGGAAILDLASGGVGRYPCKEEDLAPWKGYGQSFLASDLSVRPERHYLGIHEAESGRLLKKNARPFEMPDGMRGGVFTTGPYGFTIFRRDEKPRLWIYSWEGELRLETGIESQGDIDNALSRRVKLLLGPDGSFDGLLVAVWSRVSTRISLFDLRNQGRHSWSTEIKGAAGNMGDPFSIIGNRLLWLTFEYDDTPVPGNHLGTSIKTAMSLDLATGKAVPFIGEHVSSWYASDGQGFFFGIEKQGRKHLAYGRFAEA